MTTDGFSAIVRPFVAIVGFSVMTAISVLLLFMYKLSTETVIAIIMGWSGTTSMAIGYYFGQRNAAPSKPPSGGPTA